MKVTQEVLLSTPEFRRLSWESGESIFKLMPMKAYMVLKESVSGGKWNWTLTFYLKEKLPKAIVFDFPYGDRKPSPSTVEYCKKLVFERKYKLKEVHKLTNLKELHKLPNLTEIHKLPNGKEVSIRVVFITRNEMLEVLQALFRGFDREMREAHKHDKEMTRTLKRIYGSLKLFGYK